MCKIKDTFLNELHKITIDSLMGKVSAVNGLLIEADGLSDFATIGARCKIYLKNQNFVYAEVVGCRNNKILLVTFGDVEGIGIGCDVEYIADKFTISPSEKWLGRVVNALGESIDDKGFLPKGDKEYSLKTQAPPSHKRKMVGSKIDLGVKSLNVFTSCCLGQRLGIFAGSGVGKSVLISMLTKYANTDVKVIGLIGERGREVQEFIETYLGEEGLKQAVIVVATGDEPPVMRKTAAYLTMSIAEYFRDIGKNVLLIMDSVTRFAMAQREIGLSLGEPPTTKGYTPTVFAELPRLLERAGPGVDDASITAFFSVLVEGDDTNEPIADAVRGILDGHIVLDREIAERGRFPAINVLRSISRTMPACNNESENALVKKARILMANYNDMAEMIRIGAYRKGSNMEVDEAIFYHPKLEEFLAQQPTQKSNLNNDYKLLAEILDIN
jgi:flagellum-specific ATP synthase